MTETRMRHILRITENIYQLATIMAWVRHEPTRAEYRNEIAHEVEYLRRSMGLK